MIFSQKGLDFVQNNLTDLLANAHRDGIEITGVEIDHENFGSLASDEANSRGIGELIGLTPYGFISIKKKVKK